jgi:hypothetical protein
MQVSHFTAMTLFALFVSIAFAAFGRHTRASRIRHAATCFFLFMAFGVAVAWLLFPLSR